MNSIKVPIQNSLDAGAVRSTHQCIFDAALFSPYSLAHALVALVDTPSLSISYDSDNQWQYVEWKGKHDPVSSWAACMLMLDTLRAFPCSKILNDNSGITRTTMQLSARSLDWLTQMHAAGLQCMAWVLPQKLASRRLPKASCSTLTPRLVHLRRAGFRVCLAAAATQQRPCGAGIRSGTLARLVARRHPAGREGGGLPGCPPYYPNHDP
jgi:hypothetical protein